MILLTGATGFIGSAILKRLSGTSGTHIRTYGRKIINGQSISHVMGTIDAVTDYSLALTGVDVIIHAAARAHVMDDVETDPLIAYRNVNVAGTLNFARQAVNSGVRRFIFISSIKVNGESTEIDAPFKNTDCIHANDPYGISKAEAEAGLRKISIESGMEVVIIRPPLVYGPGVKANFSAMMNLAKKNLPLPFGAIHNKRSLVALDNLVDLIITCLDHPRAANQIFLVSDDRDVSTTELLEFMTRAAGKVPRLLPVPVRWLRLAGRLTGKQAVIDRLCGNLQVDITHTKETLGWLPPISLEEGIGRCFFEDKSC